MAVAKSKRTLEAGRRARVLIVDDSMVMRRLVTLALEHEPCLEIVGTAKNGIEAIERVSSLAPDILTMDIEMPEMDGLEALRRIRQIAPQVRVVMLSTHTERGASATLEALALGADDYVTKQSAGKSVDDSTGKLRDDLVPKLKQFFTFSAATIAADTHKAVTPTATLDIPKPRYVSEPGISNCTPRVVAIGISTGGPTALASIVPLIPQGFHLPILIVQHMPPLFTKLLCERLQERSPLCVREAIHGEIIKPGFILLAPGDFHMRVELLPGDRKPRISLDQGPPENSCRPAVDTLFESLAKVYGGATIGAILTGMGHDGLRGARLLKKVGAIIYAQDEESSAVWGMPRAVAEANIADGIFPLTDIVPQILKQCRGALAPTELRLQETNRCLK